MGCLCRENAGELAGVVGIVVIGGRPGGEEGILPTLSETPTNALICKAVGESPIAAPLLRPNISGMDSPPHPLPSRIPPSPDTLPAIRWQFCPGYWLESYNNKNQYPGETVTSSHSSFVLASFLLFSMTSTPNFERLTQTQALHVRIANELPET